MDERVRAWVDRIGALPWAQRGSALAPGGEVEEADPDVVRAVRRHFYEGSRRSRPSEDPPLELWGAEFGGFVVNDLGAIGGIGWVLRAMDAHGRDCAMKVVPLHDDTDRTWFENEVAFALTIWPGRIDHPSLLPLLGTGQYHPPPKESAAEQAPFGWLAWAWLPDAREITVECTGRSLSPEKRVGLMVVVLQGLATLHDHEVAHGDLKPNNILVSEGRPRIVDLGLAVSVGRTRGLEPYYSGDNAKKSDKRADVRAMAVILREMLGPTSEDPGRWYAVRDLISRVIERDDAVEACDARQFVQGLRQRMGAEGFRDWECGN